MKKTKLLAPVLTIAGLGATVVPLVSLTSCGDKKELKLNFIKGEHISDVSCSSKPKINDQFVINIEYGGEEADKGWTRLSTDTAKTYISVNGTKLTPGQDYEFTNNFQITVHPNVVKNTNVEICVGTDASLYDFKYNWTTTKMITENNKQILDVLPGEAIKPSDIEVIGKKGDGATETVVIGTKDEINKYSLKQTFGDDVTPQFTSADGYKFTTDMIDIQKDGPTQVDLSVKLTHETGSASNGVTIFVGNKPTSATYDAVVKDYYTQEQLSALETNETYYLCGKVGKGEHDASEFKITTPVEGCEITTDKYGNIVLKTGSTTGQITITATSRFDSSLTKSITLQIEQGE